MGNPSYEDDMHAMCFNGAKSWELNWYADNNGYRTSNPISSGNTVGAKMAALDDYLKGKTTADHSVVLKIVDNSQADDYYVMYNRKKGVNSEVVEYGDQVTITKGRAGEQSWLVGHLSLYPGQSKLELPNFGGGSVPLVVELCEVVSNTAAVDYGRINVYLKNGMFLPSCFTTVPTAPPTSRPTPRPTRPPTRQPTASPTEQPTHGPTESPSTLPPTSPTTPLPTTSPVTPAPSLRPTYRPTPVPTRRPTPSPTPRPVSVNAIV
jgi:hypothetical protein